MTRQGYLLGIDAGSSLCKAALFDSDFRLIAVARERTPLSRPHPGWSEVDPDRAWTAVVSVIREVVAKAGVAPSEIRGIGLSAAMVGAWFLDADGKVLRPGINWEDSRSQSVLDKMGETDPGFMSKIFMSSGSVLQQGCTLPVTAWFRDNQPDMLERARHIVSYKDFIRFHLTGRIATDRSEASVIPGDARIRSRSDAMLDLFGLTEFAGKFPPVMDSEALIGGLSSQAARLIGLPEGLPVSVGAGDAPCTVIGAGGLVPGRATAVLGTTCMVGICHDEPVFTPPDLGLQFSLPGDCWYRAMVNVAGTLNLDWAMTVLAAENNDAPDRYERITDLASSSPIGSNGVVYLPYLSESGIIAPVVDPHARAQFAGLAPMHTRADMLRAVFEGVAFALVDLVDLLDFDGDEIHLAGGGGRSRFWVQMIADALGRDVVLPDGDELGAKGAALILATALGDFPDMRAAHAPETGALTRFTPDEKASSAYALAHAHFRAARNQLISH